MTAALAQETAFDEAADRSGPQRRCLVTGESHDKSALLRFVVGPDQSIVPDVAGKLPGRGLWTLARRDIVAAAVKKGLFARAAREKVSVPADLADRIEALLVRRAGELLGLARRAGQAVAGFAKVEAELNKGTVSVLVEAVDGAADGREKLARLVPDLPVVEVLTAAELGAAFAREHVVHAALLRGGLAKNFLAESARLAGFRRQTVKA